MRGFLVALLLLGAVSALGARKGLDPRAPQTPDAGVHRRLLGRASVHEVGNQMVMKNEGPSALLCCVRGVELLLEIVHSALQLWKHVAEVPAEFSVAEGSPR